MAEQPKVGTRYRPFMPFAQWPRVPFDQRRWEDMATRLARRRESASAQAWAGVSHVALRAATLDAARSADEQTVDLGDTATQASWRQALSIRGLPGVQALYEAEVRAHELVGEAAAAGAGLTEELLGRIHEELIASHEQYPVDYGGRVVLEDVPAGRFKTFENYGVMSDGRMRLYAGPDRAPAEVARLTTETSTDEFGNAHPVHQSAYVLYAVDAIHPFADGNGRAARAAASLPLYGAIGLPLVVTPKSRGEYLDSLERTERGDVRPLVAFVYGRGVEAMTQALDVLAASSLS